MIKQIIIIFVLLVGIAGVSWYGYITVANGGLAMLTIDQDLSELDDAISEYEAFALTDQDLADVDMIKQELDEEDKRPVTSSELDALLKDIDSLSKDMGTMTMTLSDI